MAFKNKIAAGVGTAPVTLYTVPATLTSIVLELDAANVTQSGITATVEIYDASALTAAKLVNDVPLPPNSSIRIISGQKIVLEENDQVRVVANVAASLDVVASVLEGV